MRLSEIKLEFEGGFAVKCDGEFDNLGLVGEKELSNILTFVKDGAYVDEVYNNSCVSCVVTKPEIYKSYDFSGYGVMVCEKPDLFVYKLQNYFYDANVFYPDRRFDSEISPKADISKHAYISPKGVRIGDRTVVEPGAVILDGVTIGNDCVIGANSTVGTRGFQYYKGGDETFYVEHCAGTILKDGVEIMSGCCIAKGLFRPTVLEEGVKLDNLVHIGHSAIIRKNTLIPAGVTISGSVIVGENAWIGVHSVINSFVNVGKNAFICMGAVVNRDVPDGGCVSGNFAVNHEKHMLNVVEIAKR